MREKKQHQPERSACPLLEWQERMRGGTGKERPSRFGFEPQFGDALCGAEPDPGKTRQRKRMTRHVNDGPEQLLLEVVPPGDERFDKVPVRSCIPAKLCCGFVD